MLRYIAFCWDVTNPLAADAAQALMAQLRRAPRGLQSAFSEAGLAVYGEIRRCGAHETYPIADRGGVVLGKLFSRVLEEDAAPAAVTLDGSAGANTVRSGGKQLIERYWGQYIAFVHDCESARSFVIREPNGGVPCYVTQYRDVQIFFSDLQDCLALGIEDFSVDWQYVIARMVLPLVQVNETGLREVKQILPGECAIMARGESLRRVWYWDPVRIAQTDPIEDMQVAVAECRKTVRACISASAASYPRIIQRLSGGLDSSILLACLRSAPSRPHLTCLNHFERSVWGDERRYARLAFEQIGASDRRTGELMELERQPEDVPLRWTENVAPSALPGWYLTSCQLQHFDSPLAAKEGAAIFTGTHGDGLFFTRSAYSAVDYFYHHGFGRALLGHARASAQSQGVPVWNLLPSVIHEGLSARFRPYPAAEALKIRAQDCRFANEETLRSFAEKGERYFAPAWLKQSDRLAPGKLLHLKVMSLPAAVTNPFSGAKEPDWVMPLASQPLVELFARIPTYVLAANGETRAVARRAFASELPAEITARRSKGCGNHFLLGVFKHNAQFYQQILLDGVLVKEKLLDRRKVETFFATARDPGAKGLVELLQFHFNLELWLRSWAASAQRSGGLAAA